MKSFLLMLICIGGLSAGAWNLVNTVTQPDDSGADGVADLQRQFHSQRSVNPNSKFGPNLN